MTDWVKDAYRGLLALEQDPNDEAAIATLDRVRTEFDNVAQIFGDATFAELRARATILEDVRAGDARGARDRDAARMSEIAELKSELETRGEKVATLETNLSARQVQIVDIEAELKARGEKIAILETSLSARQAQIVEIEAERDTRGEKIVTQCRIASRAFFASAGNRSARIRARGNLVARLRNGLVIRHEVLLRSSATASRRAFLRGKRRLLKERPSLRAETPSSKMRASH